MKPSLCSAVESGGSVNSGRDQLENDEIRTVVMGTMLLQMSVKMFLTLTDEILHFHGLIISDSVNRGGLVHGQLTCFYSYCLVVFFSLLTVISLSLSFSDTVSL